MSQDQELIGAQLNLIAALIESTNAAAKKGVFLLDVPLDAKELLKAFTKENDRILAELRTCSDAPSLLSSLPKLNSSTEASKQKLEAYTSHPIVKETIEAAQCTLEGSRNVQRLLDAILKSPSTDDNASDSSRDSKKKKKEKKDKKERRKSEKKLKKSKKTDNNAESGSESDDNQSKSEFPSSQVTEPAAPAIPTDDKPQEPQPLVHSSSAPLVQSPSEEKEAHSSSESEAPPSPRQETKEDHPSGKGWKVGTWGRSGERTRSPSTNRKLLATRGESELGTSPRGGSFLSSMRSSSDSLPIAQIHQQSQSFFQPSSSPPTTSKQLEQETTTQKEQTSQEPATETAEQKSQTATEQTTTQPTQLQETKPQEYKQQIPETVKESQEPPKPSEPKHDSPKESPSPVEGSPIASPSASPRTAHRRGTARSNSDVAYRSSLMITPQQLKEAQMAFQSPIAEVNPQTEEEEEESQDNNTDNVVPVEVVVVKEQPKPVVPQKPVLEELMLYDKNGGFDLEDWNYKLDSLNRACSVTINNHTNHDLQLSQEQHDNFEWLNPPPAIIPAKRKVIIGTFSRNLFGSSKANIFYAAEGVEDKLQFSWDSQKNSSKVEKVVAYVNFPFKCEKEVSQKRKHTVLTFTITESEVRPRASTFGTGLEL